MTFKEFLNHVVLLVSGGYVTYLVVRVFGYKDRANIVQVAIWLGIGLSFLQYSSVAFGRLHDDIAQIKTGVKTVQEAGRKAQNLADTLNNVKQNPIGAITIEPNVKPPASNFWEYFTGGKFALPIKGEITQGFNEKNHGLDIAANEGDSIKAAKDGVVVEAKELPVYGLTIVIDHGDNWKTLYAHNSKLTVAVGKRVFAGDIIATAGKTGNANGVHSHFEVRYKDQPVDPNKYLKK